MAQPLLRPCLRGPCNNFRRLSETGFTGANVFMPQTDLYFVIPTYRLRDVGETVEHYDEHFWRNGHAPKIIVFDDSSPVAQEKYYPLLEQTKTHNDLYYVGPTEKEQFLAYLSRRLRDKRLDGLVKNLFRPSYGGNRNFTLMYTLGGLMVVGRRRHAALRPDGAQPRVARRRARSAAAGCTGPARTATPANRSTSSGRSSTCSASRPARCRPTTSAGEVLVDTAMDLETNATKGLARENSLLLRAGRASGRTRW